MKQKKNKEIIELTEINEDIKEAETKTIDSTDVNIAAEGREITESTETNEDIKEAETKTIDSTDVNIAAESREITESTETNEDEYDDEYEDVVDEDKEIQKSTIKPTEDIQNPIEVEAIARFKDLQSDLIRSIGDVFVVSKERFDTLSKKGFVKPTNK